jgi:N-methylhydantoinase A/oxoprolinase/acetone carboxylase beta subunit
MPVVRDLLCAVRRMLEENSIHAPLMVVRGDGSLISAATAEDRPVETVLSGPAASIAGACRLSGHRDAVVVDMGGTTTDIAVVTGGGTPVDMDGAVVGGWKTRVRAVNMWTVGLGGDSRIAVQGDGLIRLGPRRAIPLCAAATASPPFLRRIRELDEPHGAKKPMALDFFTLVKRPGYSLSRHERALFEALDGNVLHRDRIAEEIGPFIDLDQLAALGILAEVAFTPTDILHARGTIELWDREASTLGADFLAKCAGMECEELLDRMLGEIIATLCLQMTAKALHEHEPLARCWSSGNLDFLDGLLRLPAGSGIGMGVRLDRPVIGVGAPAKDFLPEAAARLGTRLIVPEHAEVANAFGAITGRVVERAEVTIRPDKPEGFLLIAADEQRRFETLAEAVAAGEEHSRQTARRRTEERGGRQIEISVDKEESLMPLASGWGDRVFLEIRLTATASGVPAY